MKVKPVVEHGDTARQEAGVLRVDLDKSYTRMDWERVKLGLVCPKCDEVQSTPFPGECELAAPDGTKLCRYPITVKSISDFIAREFHGEKWIGPRHTFDEVREIDDQLRAEQRERESRRPSGIILPRGVSS